MPLSLLAIFLVLGSSIQQACWQCTFTCLRTFTDFHVDKFVGNVLVTDLYVSKFVGNILYSCLRIFIPASLLATYVFLFKDFHAGSFQYFLFRIFKFVVNVRCLV